MPYIGNIPKYGDRVTSFRQLDDISSYICSFDGSDSSVVSAADDTISIPSHRFIQEQRITYNNGGGGNIGGILSGNAYYIIFIDTDTIKLATTQNNASTGVAVNLSAVGSGNNHTFTLAFDGVNKKFKPTYNSGGAANISRPAQLTISVNGVIQKPSDVIPPTNGFAINNGNIEFGTAPTSADVFWGNMIGDHMQSFDISDNAIDNFTGDGTTLEFGLSRLVPTNSSVLVTIDGVTQHPTDTVARAYSIFNNSVLKFTSAPALGSKIQARHIGFAGNAGGTGSVSSFGGRTGAINLQTGDNLVGVGINSTGTLIGVGVTMLNFVGAGNTFLYNAGTHTVDISIAGGGGGGSAEIDKQTFNVTSNQTVFDLTDKYTSGYIDVYVNGVRLSPADFTETDDDTITLATAAVAGDVVDFVSHSAVVQNTVLESELTNLNVTGIGTFAKTGGTVHNETRLASPDFVFETPIVETLAASVTITASTNHITFTKAQEIEIPSGMFLEVTDGDSFVIDAYQFG